jgi:zinc transport system substrate-binding protein
MITNISIVTSVRSSNRLIAVAVLLALAALACGAPRKAQTERTSVVASFYPLAFLTAEIGGSHVAVTNLTPAGAEPHDLELRPGDIRKIRDADLVVYLSGGFQAAVEDAVAEAGRVLDVKRAIGHQRRSDEEESKTDPHFWLDPVRMVGVANAIRTELASIDLRAASRVKKAAAGVVRRLEALDAEYEDGLKTCDRRDIVTAHAAFGYLAERYGLRQIPIAGLDPETEPTPGRLAEVVAQVRKLHISTIFTETLVSPKIAETLADEANVSTAVLDPIEGIEHGSTDDYFSVMRANLRALRRALGCS